MCNDDAAAPTGRPKPAYRASSILTVAANVSTASPPESNRSCYIEAIKRQAIAMRAEGKGCFAIFRALVVKSDTIYSWVKNLS